ncbi:MAG: hypothetical protein ACPLXM_03860 [Bacteroidales bacterium]
MSKMKNNPAMLLEWGWLIATVLGLFASAHSLVTRGFGNSIPLFVVTLFCAILYLLRHNNRKKSQAE